MGPRHLNIGKQHMDAVGLDLKNIQSRFGVFGMHNFETFSASTRQADQFFIFGHGNKIRSGIGVPLRNPRPREQPVGLPPFRLVTG